MKELIKSVFVDEANAVANIPIDDSYDKAIAAIYERVHEQKGKLVISGMGKAGQIAMNIATTFCSTGTPAVFLHPSEAQHGDLGVVQPNDVLLLISNSGKTREIVELVELADKLWPNLPLIVITGNKESDLGRLADVCLWTGAPKEVCLLGLTPSTSTTIMTVIGDALVVSMMKKIGFNNEEYSKRHHGGYLGDKSRRQARTEKK
jgi:arabinose-5-phosphate isomerase